MTDKQANAPVERKSFKRKMKESVRDKLNRLGAKAESLAEGLPVHWEDAEFVQDVRLATLRGAHPASKILFWTLISLLCVFFLWAAIGHVDEVTRGVGQVIPSSRQQVIQNLEGGIIAEIMVNEGTVVEAGQPLVRIDDTGFASTLGEREARYLTLLAVIARLEAEVDGKTDIDFPAEVTEKAPDIVKDALQVHSARMEEINANLNVIKRQIEQKQQELRELQNKAEQDKRNYKLAQEEYEITAPLEAQGVVSKVEILRLERQVNDLRGETEQTELAIPRARLAIRELQSKLEESRNKLVRESRAEMLEKKDEAERIRNTLTAVADQVDRTIVRSPVKGVVKQMFVSTVGGVVQPGMEIAEVIPLDDSLLVEAQVRPQDVAFIHPGQPASVKLTAYDYSIYGGLKAELVNISADTITDEEGNTFYKIRVRTDKNYLGTEERPLPIIPGMVAQVDIMTGKRSVLHYLLKPFNKARQGAFRER